MGVNFTLMVHVLLAARVDVHVLDETAKSPVVEITMPVSAMLLALVKVNTFAGLVVPTIRGA